MKKKEIRKALEGGTPFSSLYSLLPSGQKEKFTTGAPHIIVCRRAPVLFLSFS